MYIRFLFFIFYVCLSVSLRSVGALQFQMPVYGLYIWFLSLIAPSFLVIARKCKLTNYSNRRYLKVVFFVAVFYITKMKLHFSIIKYTAVFTTCRACLPLLNLIGRISCASAHWPAHPSLRRLQWGHFSPGYSRVRSFTVLEKGTIMAGRLLLRACTTTLQLRSSVLAPLHRSMATVRGRTPYLRQET